MCQWPFGFRRTACLIMVIMVAASAYGCDICIIFVWIIFVMI